MLDSLTYEHLFNPGCIKKPGHVHYLKKYISYESLKRYVFYMYICLYKAVGLIVPGNNFEISNENPTFLLLMLILWKNKNYDLVFTHFLLQMR